MATWQEVDSGGMEMSADRWSNCPICELAHKNALASIREEHKRKIALAYRQIGLEHFEKFKARLKKEEESFIMKYHEKHEESLREDFGFGIDEDGLFYVNYSAVCQVCEASWEFSKENVERTSELKATRHKVEK